MKRPQNLSMLLVFVLVLVAACGGGSSGGGADSTPQPPSNSLAITITYSPEKDAWLTERIEAFNQQGVEVNGTPVFVQGASVSSGDARLQIRNGQLETTVWSPSASTWLEVLEEETNNPDIAVSNEPLVLTPVVISMWEPMAQALGYPDESIGWNDMLELINEPEGWATYGNPEWGRFTWGHTDPEISTTALSTLIAEYYAAAGKQRDLTVEDIQNPDSQQFIRDLGQGIKHYGYNTLVFSENMRDFGMTYISAFPMEEITLIDFNRNLGNTPPLVAIYPEEGTFWHDNPFIVMASATPTEQEAAEAFYDFLLTEESQQQAMSFGFRPANVDVPLASPITEQFGVDPTGVQNILEVPSAEVIVAAKDTWSQNRKRADILLVVDTSSSMEGEKLRLVKAGLEAFLVDLLPEDRVGLVTFDNEARLVVPPEPLSDNRIALQEAIQNMRADGRTAMYDSLDVALQTFQQLPPPEEDRIEAIILLGDGLDNSSQATLQQLASNYEETGISIFPVAYGTDADTAALEEIATFSRTILVQGDEGNIGDIFRELSSYF